MAGKPKKRAVSKKAAKKRAASRQPTRRGGDPVIDWWTQAVNDRQIVGETAEKYLAGKMTYEEARKVWRQAHAHMNVWSDYEDD